MIGVDEVGRGCLAGPLLVVAARARTELPPGLRDSKLLSRLQREAIYPILIETCDFGEGWVKPSEIDKYGLGRCLRIGVRRAVRALAPELNEEIVMDGSVNYMPLKYKKTRCQINADADIAIVSAASIFAKVTRDRFMIKLAKKHPKYNFENHVGYGTTEHYEALGNFGPLKFIHRASFAPFRSMELT